MHTLLEHVDLGVERDARRERRVDALAEFGLELRGRVRAVLGGAEDGAEAHELLVRELHQRGERRGSEEVAERTAQSARATRHRGGHRRAEPAAARLARRRARRHAAAQCILQQTLLHRLPEQLQEAPSLLSPRLLPAITRETITYWSHC